MVSSTRVRPSSILQGVRPATPRHRAGTEGVPNARRIYTRIAWWTAATDAASIILALILALGIGFMLRDSLLPISRDWLIAVSVTPLVWVGVFYAHGLYALEHLSKFEELRRLVNSSTAGIVVMVMIGYWSRASFSRIWVGLAWFLAVAFEIATRSMWRHHMERLRKDGHLSLRTIIIGSNGEAHRLGKGLSAPGSGFLPLSLYSPHDLYLEERPGMEVRRYGGNLRLAIEEQQAECLFVASSDVTPEEMMEIARLARVENVDVRLSASLPEMISTRVAIQPVAGIMSMSFKPVHLSGVQALMKRTFDLTLATFMLVLTLPISILVAIAIKLESRGPVLFRQARITQGGRIFQMHKFRTMRHRPCDEDDLDTTVPFFKLEGDPRVTTVGRILRKASLDELPQLLNVVKGEMSLVGPRPLPIDQVEANPDLLTPRLEVPAGATGWWQISGRSRVGAEEAVKMDLFYIDNWSLGLDVYILFRTLGAVVTRRGAH